MAVSFRERHVANERGGTLGGVYWVWTIGGQGIVEVSTELRPQYGGYLSEKKYGFSGFCPTATRWHKKRFVELGEYPNLVWFDSVLAAVMAKFSPCGSCLLKGNDGERKWEEYLEACRQLRVKPGPTPKRFR